MLGRFIYCTRSFFSYDFILFYLISLYFISFYFGFFLVVFLLNNTIIHLSSFSIMNCSIYAQTGNGVTNMCQYFLLFLSVVH